MNKYIRWFYTLKELKFIQIYSQVLYRLLGVTSMFSFFKSYSYSSFRYLKFVDFKREFYGNVDKLSFTFLNKSFNFIDKVNWNETSNGMLWCYNLNYFDFIHTIDKNEALDLVEDFNKSKRANSIGLDPYPISLRNINLIKLYSKNKETDGFLIDELFNDYKVLTKKIEYHLLGNHLLENGFSLLFGAYFFEQDDFYRIARKLIIDELNEEILSDGAHFELSPMYHSIILERLLDSINLVENNNFKNDDLLVLMREKASLMLGWLNKIKFNNNEIPLVNDSSLGVAMLVENINKYGSLLGVIEKDITLKESGYRKFSNQNFELLADVGEIGPKYIPGHAHADTFNFLLQIKGLPVFIDTGISTYDKDKVRCYERSTQAHNTVVVNNLNSSDTWGGFRVGKRASVKIIEDNTTLVKAEHNGFESLGMKHQREFKISENTVVIGDEIVGIGTDNVAFFHVDNSFDVSVLGNKEVQLKSKEDIVSVVFEGSESIDVSDSSASKEFNKLYEISKIAVSFKQNLKTTISIIEK